MKHNYKVMEVAIDITSHISNYLGQSGYSTVDSRTMVGKIIDWAEEFETAHKHTKWGIDLDYMETVEQYAEQKRIDAIENGYFNTDNN